MAYLLKKVAGSDKSAHQHVLANEVVVGDIWREQVSVLVSKFTEPRRMAVRWRWFARPAGASGTLGRGTRAAMLFGPGFTSREEALSALAQARGDETPAA